MKFWSFENFRLNHLLFILFIYSWYFIHLLIRSKLKLFLPYDENKGKVKIIFNVEIYYIFSNPLPCNYVGTGLENPPPPLFDLKIVYSYVIEVADSEYDLGLHGRALVSEIFAFYHLLKFVLRRPGRRAHVHLGHNFSIQKFFLKFLTFFCLLCSWGLWGCM